MAPVAAIAWFIWGRRDLMYRAGRWYGAREAAWNEKYEVAYWGFGWRRKRPRKPKD